VAEVKDEEGTVKAELVCTLTSRTSAQAFISFGPRISCYRN
jgi:hypothetical protein